ncbi:MAG TPA: hypothetical protein VIZ29_05345, partial [Gaiellaceae bacterium]
MTLYELLDAHGRLVAEVGVAVETGDTVLVDADVEVAALARSIARAGCRSSTPTAGCSSRPSGSR